LKTWEIWLLWGENQTLKHSAEHHVLLDVSLKHAMMHTVTNIL